MSGPKFIRWCDHCATTRYAACSPVCRIPNDHKDNWIRNVAVEDEELVSPELAEIDAQTGGLHPESLCGRDCTGCVSEKEGA